jgi:uncharacterized protein
MLNFISSKAFMCSILAALLINCSGDKAKGQERTKSADTAAVATQNQTTPPVDTAQAAFTIAIEGYKATELGQAVYVGDLGKIQDLINKGAPTEKCLTDETYVFDMLYAALAFNKTEVVRYVLKNKLYTSVNTTYSEDAETPLTMACSLNDSSDAVEIADSLIKLGANAKGAGESGGETTKYPLIIAVTQHNFKLTKLLLENHADKAIKNEAGETPAEIAKKLGFEDISKLLEGN